MGAVIKTRHARQIRKGLKAAFTPNYLRRAALSKLHTTLEIAAYDRGIATVRRWEGSSWTM